GADVNAKDSNGAMPLHKCLFNDPMRLDAVEVLLQHGADIAPAKKYVEVVVSPYTKSIAELVDKYDAK
ncbi:MAG: hypothetical protein KDA66_21345, partial [Planctomycetaceae bacterium]|nr:hypothetical protein [Planctomycetaceae bacterium]